MLRLKSPVFGELGTTLKPLKEAFVPITLEYSRCPAHAALQVHPQAASSYHAIVKPAVMLVEQFSCAGEFTSAKTSVGF